MAACQLATARERCETLPFAIHSCLTHNHDRFTVIVSDDMSRDEIRTIFESIDDDRLRYINPQRRLDVSANFNFALNHAEDDAVSAKSNGAPQQLVSAPHEEAKYLAENDIPIHSSLVYFSAPSVVMGETFLQVKDRFPGLTAGLSPDLARMCMHAESETSQDKMSGVKPALEKIRATHSLAAASSVSKLEANNRPSLPFGSHGASDSRCRLQPVWRHRCLRRQLRRRLDLELSARYRDEPRHGTTPKAIYQGRFEMTPEFAPRCLA